MPTTHRGDHGRKHERSHDQSPAVELAIQMERDQRPNVNSIGTTTATKNTDRHTAAKKAGSALRRCGS